MKLPCELNDLAFLLGCDTLPGGLYCNQKINETCVAYCPYGFYCPERNNIVKSCSKGTYCQLGSDREKSCGFGTLSCPNTEMGHQSETNLFVVLLLVISILYLIYYFFSKLRMANSEVKFDKAALQAADALYKEKAEQKCLQE
jgi:hypothetical protein